MTDDDLETLQHLLARYLYQHRYGHPMCEQWIEGVLDMVEGELASKEDHQ